MTCPRCETRPLIEIDRDGVTVDRCEHCRGIWLDRGELDKLIAHARNEERGLRPAHDDDDHDDDDDDRRERHAGGRRKRSIWDIFD